MGAYIPGDTQGVYQKKYPGCTQGGVPRGVHKEVYLGVYLGCT